MRKLGFIITLILILSLLQVNAEAKERNSVIGAVQKIAPLPEVAEQQDQFTVRCVAEVVKEQPEIDKRYAQAQCKFRQLKTNAITLQAETIKDMASEDFMELQKGKMLLAVDKCSTVNCVNKFRRRIGKLSKLNARLQKKLQEIEEKKLDKIKKFNDLRQSEHFLKYNPPIDFRARAIDPIQLDIERKNFIKAEQNFVSIKERARIAKQQFDKAKVGLTGCVVNNTEVNTPECDETRKVLNTKAKEHLLNTADRILEHLKKLKSKIGTNEELTEEEAFEMIDKLDEQITIIEEEKAKIEDAESKNEIINSAKRLRLVWARIKLVTSIQTQRTVNAKIGGIIIRLNQLGIKLERVMARITEDAIDVSGIEPLIKEFDEDVEEAKSNYEKAQETFIEGKSKDLPDADLIKEAQEFMQKANKSLQDAQKRLRDILLSIKDVGGIQGLESASEEKIEEQLEGQI